MLKTLKLLNESSVVTDYEVQDFRRGSDFYYVKAKAWLENNFILFIREYVSETEYKYSYHWQTNTGEILIRWDNSPHHKEISTFPHHKHVGDNIEASYEIEIEAVLNYIANLRYSL